MVLDKAASLDPGPWVSKGGPYIVSGPRFLPHMTPSCHQRHGTHEIKGTGGTLWAIHTARERRGLHPPQPDSSDPAGSTPFESADRDRRCGL